YTDWNHGTPLAIPGFTTSQVECVGAACGSPHLNNVTAQYPANPFFEFTGLQGFGNPGAQGNVYEGLVRDTAGRVTSHSRVHQPPSGASASTSSSYTYR